MWLVHISTLITISLFFWQGNSTNQECGLSALGLNYDKIGNHEESVNNFLLAIKNKSFNREGKCFI